MRETGGRVGLFRSRMYKPTRVSATVASKRGVCRSSLARREVFDTPPTTAPNLDRPPTRPRLTQRLQSRRSPTATAPSRDSAPTIHVVVRPAARAPPTHPEPRRADG